MFQVMGMFDRSLGMFQPSGALTTFTPAELFAAGEQGVWYDPSDWTTLFQDSAGTTPVTAIEQPVGLILDKSGRGNHASQPTTTSRPILRQEAGGQYYLAFDGVDDFLVTANINFSATDKMSVFAGVRKLSDAAANTIAELSATIASNAGTFLLRSSADYNGVAGAFYGALSRGTAALASNQYANASGFAAPITNILAVTHNISGDSTALRVNGAVLATATGDQGAGNFGTYPLYIGRRGGTTFPFNGRIYSLLVRGALTSSPQLEQTEKWVAAKTGVTI